MTARRRGYVLVVTIDAAAAPTVLFFGELARVRPTDVRIAQYRRDPIATLLGGASAVIFVRGLFEFGELVSAAAAFGMPRYYFLDDNFVLICEQGGEAARFVTQYSESNMRTALAGFAGVLLATEPLIEDFRRRGLHSRLHLFPPTAIAAVPQADRPGCRIAFFGGAHLRDVFGRIVLPAIRRFARDRDVALVAVGIEDAIEPSRGLRIERWPYHSSYLEGVRALAAAGVTVIVHPSAAGLANNAFKNPHALITANAVGAVPIVSNTAPYDGLGGVALLCRHSEEDWHRALVEAADPQRVGAMRERLASYCTSAFGGARNRAMVDEMLSLGAPPPMVVVLRSAVVMSYLVRAQIRRVVNRCRRLMSGGAATAIL
ncbi:MAG: hypothetical protein WD690_00240 [Vicinamibacterales bacterium]